jgi:hypothetical protein
VEVHLQTRIQAIQVLLEEAISLSEASDGDNTLNSLGEVVDHRSLGDGLETSQLPRRRQVVAL